MNDLNYILGKILLHYEKDEKYCVSEFTHVLTDNLVLAYRLDPSTGKRLPIEHIIDIRKLTDDDEIYDSFEIMNEYIQDVQDDDGNKRTIQ
jgi:hypothetical protein